MKEGNLSRVNKGKSGQVNKASCTSSSQETERCPNTSTSTASFVDSKPRLPCQLKFFLSLNVKKLKSKDEVLKKSTGFLIRTFG